MEQWTWPPSPDEGYQPEADSPYWFAVRETMNPDERDAAIVVRIRDVMQWAWDKAPFYRRLWGEAGIHPSHITSLEDFERVPVVTKARLREAQERHQPFGDYLCVEPEEVRHVHGTSGTTGRPTVFGISQPDWRSIANAHARVMWGMGIRPADTVFLGSFFSLYMGSWGALVGTERLGATAFPFGAGAPGQTLRAVNWMLQMRPSALYATPSYALYIAEIAAEQGIDARDFGVKTLLFSGEPGASIPSIRHKIEDLYGGHAFDCGSMAEMSPWMHLGESTGRTGMLAWQDIVYTEVCDPQTFSRVAYGGEGTPVYTHLERTSQPMIRLLSGDLTRWEAPGTSPCGRTYPVLPKGIYGRIDDMFTVRGENIYPSAIDEVVSGIAHYGGEHRIVVSRTRAMDELTVQVEHDAELVDPEGWARQVADQLRTVLGVGARVDAVVPGTLERTEFKARRVVDTRDLEVRA